MLNPEITAMINLHSIGTIGTVARDGSAAVSHKATFLVLDDETIAFADIRSPGTVANAERDPRVEVVFSDPFHRTGCRIKGRARYRSASAESPAVMAAFRDRWPDLYPRMRGIMTIRCDAVAFLWSPSYDDGAAMADLAGTWLRRFADHLGYDVVQRAC